MNIKYFVLPALLSLASSVAFADDCAATIGANDAMQFDKKAITIGKACKKFTVTLNHTGKLAKNVMGHNWVLTKTEEAQAVATDGVAAGVDKNYLKEGDARIIAASKLVGGGESATVDIPVAKLAKGTYTYFCSFPGHISLMKGTLTVE
ncbi:MAG: azurin [Gammaproteobacteria bacterium]|nr:MAG: azurin [Gammaproteobacteria bacterium]